MRDELRGLTEAYAAALGEHGATPQGLLWPNATDLGIRYETLLERSSIATRTSGAPLRLLDLGCGVGFLLDYLAANDLLDRVEYTGVDTSDAVVSLARSRWPGYRFEVRDVREHPFAGATFDFCLICGLFTGRFDVPIPAMEAFARGVLTAVWPSVTTGLAFNTMSKHVDWERDDLFHWPLDSIMAFARAELSRHVSFRLDYGLWEVAVAVLHEPRLRTTAIPQDWSPS